MRPPNPRELHAAGALALGLFTAWLIAAAQQALDFDRGCLSHLRAALHSDRAEEAGRELERAIAYLHAREITAGQVSFLTPGSGGDIGAWLTRLTEAARRLHAAAAVGEGEVRRALSAYRSLVLEGDGAQREAATRLRVPPLIFLYPHAGLYVAFGAVLALALGAWAWLVAAREMP